MKSELTKLATLLENEYGSSECGEWEITKAEKFADTWELHVKAKKASDSKGAENESN